MKVITMEHTEQLDKVTLIWSTVGMYDDENPIYSVK
ncbi:unnamed protein product [Cylicostephanus goldi]|uniref:Uncharacterized protein n=1 Tax=Cylicostephanus goldi TaxID=71465 RepID=A0A3P7N3N7_CYLGO|nr:unnamed protein product [Cylicostephanus goldi]